MASANCCINLQGYGSQKTLCGKGTFLKLLTVISCSFDAPWDKTSYSTSFERP